MKTISKSISLLLKKQSCLSELTRKTTTPAVDTSLSRPPIRLKRPKKTSRAARATLFERRRHPLLSRPNRRPLLSRPQSSPSSAMEKEIIAGGAANGHTCFFTKCNGYSPFDDGRLAQDVECVRGRSCGPDRGARSSRRASHARLAAALLTATAPLPPHRAHAGDMRRDYRDLRQERGVDGRSDGVRGQRRPRGSTREEERGRYAATAGRESLPRRPGGAREDPAHCRAPGPVITYPVRRRTRRAASIAQLAVDTCAYQHAGYGSMLRLRGATS